MLNFSIILELLELQQERHAPGPGCEIDWRRPRYEALLGEGSPRNPNHTCVAFDGPAGTGKDKLGGELKEMLGLGLDAFEENDPSGIPSATCVHFDSGALLRRIALYLLSQDIHPKHISNRTVQEALSGIPLTMLETYPCYSIDGVLQCQPEAVFLIPGVDYKATRSDETDMLTAQIAEDLILQLVMNVIREAYIRDSRTDVILMDGRDVGLNTLRVDLPVFVTASIEERTDRRTLAKLPPGLTPENITPAEYDRVWQRTKEGLLARDAIDEGRPTVLGRLEPNARALYIDRTGLPTEELASIIRRIIGYLRGRTNHSQDIIHSWQDTQKPDKFSRPTAYPQRCLRSIVPKTELHRDPIFQFAIVEHLPTELKMTDLRSDDLDVTVYFDNRDGYVIEELFRRGILQSGKIEGLPGDIPSLELLFSGK